MNYEIINFSDEMYVSILETKRKKNCTRISLKFVENCDYDTTVSREF